MASARDAGPSLRSAGATASARWNEALRSTEADVVPPWVPVIGRVGAPVVGSSPPDPPEFPPADRQPVAASPRTDRKSTRLNSSHANISYAVFCLKKKIT